MVCKHCGAQIKDGSKFCIHCGKPISSVKQRDVWEDVDPYGTADSYDDPYNDLYNDSSYNRNKTPIIVGVVVAVLAITVVWGAVVLHGMKSESSDDTQTANVTNETHTKYKQVTETPTPTPTEEITATPAATEAPTAMPTANPAPNTSVATDNSYIFADSSSRLLSESELVGLSEWQLRIARNEMYARHGKIFQSTDLQNYFNSQSWYTPSTSFSSSQMNQTELKNAKLISDYEAKCGYSSSSSSSGSSTASSSSNTATDNSYIFADSDTRLLSQSELVGLSAWELRIARNEICARHGRTFKTTELQNYFNNQMWYVPSASYDDSMLNSTERANAKLITDYEASLGISY